MRLSLDQIEKLVLEAFEVPCYCAGSDTSLVVYLEAYEGDLSQVKEFITNQSSLFHKAIEVKSVAKFKRTESGKIIF